MKVIVPPTSSDAEMAVPPVRVVPPYTTTGVVESGVSLVGMMKAPYLCTAIPFSVASSVCTKLYA